VSEANEGSEDAQRSEHVFRRSNRGGRTWFSANHRTWDCERQVRLPGRFEHESGVQI